MALTQLCREASTMADAPGAGNKYLGERMNERMLKSRLEVDGLRLEVCVSGL